MVEIRSLTAISADDLTRLIEGYESEAKYVVAKIEAPAQTVITLQLITLDRPYRRRWEPPEADLLERYRQMPADGFSFGAYDNETLVGLALAEPEAWNNTLRIWEFHIATSHQRRGLGRQLMEAVAKKARAAGLRSLVCETQNTNVPAIQFYRAVGFTLEAIDLSYYTNADLEPSGEVAVFMKRRLF
jgi:ribosomal protein S18 acetylase RimI-like enzyme